MFFFSLSFWLEYNSDSCDLLYPAHLLWLFHCSISLNLNVLVNNSLRVSNRRNFTDVNCGVKVSTAVLHASWVFDGYPSTPQQCDPVTVIWVATALTWTALQTWAWWLQKACALQISMLRHLFVLHQEQPWWLAVILDELDWIMVPRWLVSGT